MPGASSSIVVLLFTDLVSSTELLERLGEDAAEKLRRTHFSLLRDVVSARGGLEVKSVGDGLMVVFPSAVDALDSAVAIQQAVHGHDQLRSQVRVGLHVGEPIRDEDDYFGMPVVVATRLCNDIAAGGQVIASDLVRRLVGSRGGHTFRDLGAFQLKGIAEPVPACEVAWEPAKVAPPAQPAITRAFRTILFTDVHGSTPLWEQLGDDQAWLVKQAWARLTREAVEGFDGTVVKDLGDGALASFSSARKAVECAVSIQQRLAVQQAEEAQAQVKMGLNAGEPIVSDDDVFGTAVTLAARICGQAAPGQVLVSDVVRGLVAGKDFLFADLGEIAVRGYEDPVRLYEVRWRAED
jgi:class 3 adenylate cyclase